MISLDGQYFSFGDIYSVQNAIEQVKLSAKARAKVAKSRTLIEQIIEKKHRIYGVLADKSFHKLVKDTN